MMQKDMWSCERLKDMETIWKWEALTVLDTAEVSFHTKENIFEALSPVLIKRNTRSK